MAGESCGKSGHGVCLSLQAGCGFHAAGLGPVLAVLKCLVLVPVFTFNWRRRQNCQNARHCTSVSGGKVIYVFMQYNQLKYDMTISSCV